MALQFPASRIVPTEDATERAMHAIVDAANTFEHAVVDAQSVSRCLQLRERITACLAVLTGAERAAFDKADLLSAAKD